jgi:hypothetical protein
MALTGLRKPVENSAQKEKTERAQQDAGTKHVPEFIDPRFHENKPKTLVFSHRKRAFWACFRENRVYNFRRWPLTKRMKNMPIFSSTLLTVSDGC